MLDQVVEGEELDRRGDGFARFGTEAHDFQARGVYFLCFLRLLVSEGAELYLRNGREGEACAPVSWSTATLEGAQTSTWPWFCLTS